MKPIRPFARLAVLTACALLLLGAREASALASLTVSASQSPRTVSPGDADVVLMTITVSNSTLGPRALTRIRFTNTTTGPGAVADRDAEVSTVGLYTDVDGNNVFGKADTLVDKQDAKTGEVRFDNISVSCPTNTVTGMTTRFFVVTSIPTVARDGDALDLAINDMRFDQNSPNNLPIAPAGTFPIDGMTSFQIPMTAGGTSSLLAGTTNNLVLDFVLPPNGYESDLLQTLTITNAGTALATSDITSLKVWVDNGDDLFSPVADRLLGALAFTGGSRWQMTGLAETLPRSGLRLFVSADLNDFATEGRTVRLALPTLPDVSVGVASTNDGPIDRAVEAPNDRVVSTANRVTLFASTVPGEVVHPGQAQVPLLHIAATNSYSTPQVLDELIVTNAGVDGSIADRDHAVQSLTLRLDGNGDGVLGSLAVDPPLGTAFFSDGRATFSGIGYSLAAGSSRRLFVTADVSLTGASDGDTLSARIAGPLDVSFADTTRVTASWPLDSRARAAVDGMMAAQITVVPPAGATLAPSDSNVLALDVRVPRNGHLDDVLQRLEIVNQGTAAGTDVAEVHLWRDGGDGVFTPGSGDDIDLGVAPWTGSSWLSAPLTQPLGIAGARVFAVLRIASSPLDGTTLRLALPVLGVTVASGDDGPIDGAVGAGSTLLISNSPLLASLSITPSSSTSGQTINVAMLVRNTGSESIAGITPSALTAAGAGSLTPATGPTPASLTLAPGAADTIRWTYVAANPGNVQLSGTVQGTGNPSGTPRASLTATSNIHHVFAAVAHLDASITTSLPTTVNLGQTDVIPMTLRFTNGAAEGAPVRLTGLRIRIEDQAGGGIVPDQLLARVAVHEGTTLRLSRANIESSGDQVDLTLTAPSVVHASETAELTIGLDIKNATTVASFKVAVISAAWLTAEDVNTGTSVPVQLTSGSFPVRTGLARIVEKPSELDIAALAGTAPHAGPAQTEVPLVTLRLTSPGAAGITNDVRVTALAFDAADTLGVPLGHLADVLGWIRVRTAFQTLASRGVFVSDGPLLTLLLSPALSVPANTPIDLFVTGDITASAQAGAFRLRLADSTRVDARDAATQDRVPVVMTADPLPGPTVTIEAPADTVRVAGTPRMPASVRAGDPGITAMTIHLKHPGGPGTAPLRVDSLVLLSRDEQRRPLVPVQYLDRIRVLWNGVECGSEPNPPAFGEATRVPTGGRMLAPGDSALLDVVVDFAAVAPEGFLELWVFGDGVYAADANLGTRAEVMPQAAPLPLFSGLARIQAPARVLTAGLASTLPAALAGDGRAVGAATLTLTNSAASGAGDITLDHLTVRAADGSYAAAALGALAERMTASVGGVVWAQSGTLTSDSTTATLVAGTPLAIAPGTPALVELRLVPRQGLDAGTLRVGLDASGVGVVQPGSALLQITVLPASGQTFPLWSEPGSFNAMDLASSYSNFPNPFAAGRQDTHFAYYMKSPGRAWLKVMTLAGESVATLVDGDARGAGMQQNDGWDGRNGDGRPVRNGVYVAELLVHYDDGSQARVLRKVAVVR